MPEEYWKLVEPIWDQISIHDGPEKFLLDFGKAPERSRILHAAHWAQSEAMNGGLGQFFDNPTGILAPFRCLRVPNHRAFRSSISVRPRFQTSLPSKKSQSLSQSRIPHILNSLENTFSSLAGANSNR